MGDASVCVGDYKGGIRAVLDDLAIAVNRRDNNAFSITGEHNRLGFIAFSLIGQLNIQFCSRFYAADFHNF